METVFTWMVTQIKRRSSDGMIYQVEYKVIGNRGDFRSSANNYVRLKPSLDPTPFDDVTEEEVIGWVKSKLGSEKEQKIYDLINHEINKKESKLNLTGFPWQAVGIAST